AEVVPRVAGLAVVLAYRAPLPLAQVGAPLLPRRLACPGGPQPESLDGLLELGRHRGGPLGGPQLGTRGELLGGEARGQLASVGRRVLPLRAPPGATLVERVGGDTAFAARLHRPAGQCQRAGSAEPAHLPIAPVVVLALRRDPQ